MPLSSGKKKEITVEKQMWFTHIYMYVYLHAQYIRRIEREKERKKPDQGE